jgi:4-hydroxy-2-oxoglutarate aldolase
MKSPLSMTGVFPPIPTPFDAAGEIDLKALGRNMEFWNRYPLAGYVVLGSNGEFPYLSESETLAFFEAVRKHIPPDRIFMAGTACESTHSSIAMTKAAASMGADVAILITPSYYKSKMDAEGLTHYYLSIADASPIPVSIYNMPLNTGVDMTPDLIISLSRHPNIAGVKDSSGNLAKMGEVIHSARPGFQVLAGSAGFFYPALCIGASGGVMALANIAPSQCCDIMEFFKEGKHDEAKELQLRMIASNTAVTARFGVPGLKAALDMLGQYGGNTRSPMLPLTEAQKGSLRNILKEAGILPA